MESLKYIEQNELYLSRGIKAGTTYECHLRYPVTDAPLAVLVTFDLLNMAEAEAMEALAKSGEAPPCVVIGIHSGRMHATNEGGFERHMRFADLDLFTSEYADFIVDELIPYFAKKYSLNISPDPNMHSVAGGSSGGISAWNCVWFRNDYFRRTYLSSPTFSALGRGNVAPIWMRVFETKDVRVYLDYSENEPDDYFGSSLCAAMEGRTALEFAGYDYEWAYYSSEGHCSRWGNRETAETVFRFLWKNWQTEPVRRKRLSKRAEKLIYPDVPWEICDAFPCRDKTVALSEGTYSVKAGSIVFSDGKGQRTVAGGYSESASLALSSDLWRLYVADRDRGCVYSYVIEKDGGLSGKRIHASVHAKTDFTFPGVFDMTTDECDRIYAATELGIQCIRAYGLIDLIMPLPKNEIPLRVELVGDLLYADCGDVCYRRKIKMNEKSDPTVPTEPKFNGYY